MVNAGFEVLSMDIGASEKPSLPKSFANSSVLININRLDYHLSVSTGMVFRSHHILERCKLNHVYEHF